MWTTSKIVRLTTKSPPVSQEKPGTQKTEEQVETSGNGVKEVKEVEAPMQIKKNLREVIFGQYGLARVASVRSFPKTENKPTQQEIDELFEDDDEDDVEEMCNEVISKEPSPVNGWMTGATAKQPKKDKKPTEVESKLNNSETPSGYQRRSQQGPLNRVKGQIGSSPVIFTMDEGAGGSLLPAEVAKKLNAFAELEPWTGPGFESQHGAYKVLGGLYADVTLADGITLVAHFCVVEASQEILLGEDFLQRYQISRDWKRMAYVGRTIPDGKEFIAPIIHAPNLIRSLDSVEIGPYQSRWIKAYFPVATRQVMKVVVEPTFTTNGALRLMSDFREVTEGQEELMVHIANFTDEEITVDRDALVGQAVEGELCNSKSKMHKNHGNAADIRSVKTYYEELLIKRDEDVKNAALGAQLTKKQAKKVLKWLYENHREMFSVNPNAPKRYHGPTFKINTGDAKPIKGRPRRQPPAKESIIEDLVKTMEENDIVEPSISPWASPVVLVMKKDGSPRFCVDYRELNNVTEKDSYALPRVDDTIDAISSKNRVYTVLDAHSGYWQVPVDEQDREKTAFTTRSGLYQYKRMPFGLTNAPAAFMRAMDNALRGLTYLCCLVFIDDIVVFSVDFESHFEALNAVLERLREHGFTLKLSKCLFFSNRITYLGHVIEEGRVTVEPQKVEAIANYPPPTDLKKLQRYMGMLTWYRRFIPNFAEVAAPLHELLSKDPIVPWEIHVDGTKQNNAFKLLKQKLMEFPILRLPDFDKEFIVIPDASKFGVGGILAQEIDGFEHPVHYISKALKKTKRDKHSYELETYALLICLRAFEHYLFGRKFKVMTDCRALSQLKRTKKEVPQKIARWLSEILSYDFDIVHRPGREVPTSDALSRAEEPNEELVVHQIRFAKPAEMLGIGMEELIRNQETNRPTKKLSVLLKQIEAGNENVDKNLVEQKPNEDLKVKTVGDVAEEELNKYTLVNGIVSDFMNYRYLVCQIRALLTAILFQKVILFDC